MNIINSFYSLRFLFYLILPENIHAFPDAGTAFARIDLFISSFAGIFMAGTLAYQKISIKRAKQLFIIPPLILILPAFLIPIIALINRQFADFVNSTLTIFDMLFALYSISFSLLLPYLILNKFNSTKQIYIYSFSLFVLGLTGLVLTEYNRFLAGLIHNIPFIIAGSLLNKKIVNENR
jgi:hypothetical protein